MFFKERAALAVLLLHEDGQKNNQFHHQGDHRLTTWSCRDHSHARSRAGCGRSFFNRPSGRSSGRSSSPSSDRSSNLPNDPSATRRAASSRPPQPRTPCPHSLDHEAAGTLAPCDVLIMGLAWWLQEGFTRDINSYPTWRVHARMLRILLTLATLSSGGRDQGQMSSLRPN